MATLEQNRRASFLKIIPEQSAPSALFSNHSHCLNVSKFRAMPDTNQNLFDKKKIIEKLITHTRTAVFEACQEIAGNIPSQEKL